MHKMNINDTKHVASDTIKGYYVSTVWLGIDHNHCGILSDLPLLFESMIFIEGDTNWHDKFMRRYSSWEDAEKGHKIICDLILQRGNEDAEGFIKLLEGSIENEIP